MAIKKLPVLPEDYPIFDWSDHQSSYDALVEGGLVSNFKKETWNAIVDTINNVLIEAGFEWDDIYTTADVAKIGVAYGALSAEMFNSVRHNIDHPIALGWGWASKPDFRGYVGREDFYGMSTHGKDADLFYPEYLKELVRRLNMLIEILKDKGCLEHVIGFDSSNSVYISPLRPDHSGIQVTRAISETNPYLPLSPDKSAIWLSRAMVDTMHDSKLIVDRSSAMNLTHISSINHKSPLIVDLSSLLGALSTSFSSEKSRIQTDESIVKHSFGSTISDSSALLIADRLAYVDSKWFTKTNSDAFMDLDRPNYIKAMWSADSVYDAFVRLERPTLKESRWSAKSTFNADMDLDSSILKQTSCMSRDLAIGILSYIGYVSLIHKQAQYTQSIATGDVLAASHLFANRNRSMQLHIAQCEPIEVNRMSPEKHITRSSIVDMFRVPHASVLDGNKYSMYSDYRSILSSYGSLSIETIDYLLKTDSVAGLSACRDISVVPEKWLIASCSLGSVYAISSEDVQATNNKSFSTEKGTVNLSKPEYVSGEHSSYSNSSGSVEAIGPLSIRGRDWSISDSKGKMTVGRPTKQKTKVTSTGKTIAILESAWYPAVWTDRGLYIRQTTEAIPNGNRLEVR